MTATRPWWHQRNAELAALAPEHMRWLGPDAAIPDHVLDLLDAVEARFEPARSVADWDDPHDDPRAPYGRREPVEAEYSRLSHPERYAVVGERRQAWVDELVGRGLAEVEEVAPPRSLVMGERVSGGDGWLLRPHAGVDRVQVVRPRRRGALPLVLGGVGTTAEHEALVVATGTPFVEVDLVPDCGCDACDQGSAELLREVDEAVLAVVDGSLRVRVSARSAQVAGSGSASGSTWSRSETRIRRRVLGRQVHDYAGPPWDPAWPVRRSHPFV